MCRIIWFGHVDGRVDFELTQWTLILTWSDLFRFKCHLPSCMLSVKNPILTISSPFHVVRRQWRWREGLEMGWIVGDGERVWR